MPTETKKLGSSDEEEGKPPKETEGSEEPQKPKAPIDESAERAAKAVPEKGTRFTASEIHKNISEEAEEEMTRPASELMFSALGSGLIISFSFLAVAFVNSFLPERYHDLGAAVAYPLGFIYVVLSRHQLFTENTLEPVVPVLEKRDSMRFKRLLRLWGIVLPFNLLGTLIFALVLAHTEVVKPELRDSLFATAQTGVHGGFTLVFYKGIWAGWLIAGMAWLIASTHDTTAQIILAYLTTAPIAAFGFKHSIAGATEAFYLAAIGAASWGEMLGSFEVPAVLGNIIGGVVLVALLNHGQVGKSKG